MPIDGCFDLNIKVAVAGVARCAATKAKAEGPRATAAWPTATDGRYQDYEGNPNSTDLFITGGGGHRNLA